MSPCLGSRPRRRATSSPTPAETCLAARRSARPPHAPRRRSVPDARWHAAEPANTSTPNSRTPRRSTPNRPRPSMRSGPVTLAPRPDPTDPRAPARPSPSRSHPPGSTAGPAPTETDPRTTRRRTTPGDDQPGTPRRCRPAPTGGTTPPRPTTPDPGRSYPASTNSERPTTQSRAPADDFFNSLLVPRQATLARFTISRISSSRASRCFSCTSETLASVGRAPGGRTRHLRITVSDWRSRRCWPLDTRLGSVRTPRSRTSGKAIRPIAHSRVRVRPPDLTRSAGEVSR